MKENQIKNYLNNLLDQPGKHTKYQKLASSINIDIDKEVKTRYETERLNYITGRLNINGMNICDIGGNTGFFTFELINKGASFIDYFEINKNHADFVKEAAKIIGVKKRINIYNNIYDFSHNNSRSYDLILCLNILHHLGDDFEQTILSVNEAKKYIIRFLNNLYNKTEKLVFQVGYNWKGNINLPLFPFGTKKEMIDFITNGINKYWDIVSIGIPEQDKGSIIYKELSNNNIERNDKLGEFLNRPLFIMKSKNKKR